MEEWRTIPGYEGLYEVSSHGRVRKTTGHIMTLKDTGKGYLQVGLSGRGKRQFRYVSNMVLEAFVGPRPEGHECCHDDNDKSNNRVGNLYWGTHLQNEIDKVRHGAVPKGTSHGMSKLSPEFVIKARLMVAQGSTLKEVADLVGVTKQAIWFAVKEKTWRHV